MAFATFQRLPLAVCMHEMHNPGSTYFLPCPLGWLSACDCSVFIVCTSKKACLYVTPIPLTPSLSLGTSNLYKRTSAPLQKRWTHIKGIPNPCKKHSYPFKGILKPIKVPIAPIKESSSLMKEPPTILKECQIPFTESPNLKSKWFIQGTISP